MIDVEIVKSYAVISDDLWERCFPPPLEGKWWYEALEQCGLEDQFNFSYALMRQNGICVGIAPLFLMNLPLDVVTPEPFIQIGRVIERVYPGLLRPPALFVGSPCGEEGAVGLLPGVDRRAVLLCLQDYLEVHARTLGARMLIWKDFPDTWRPDFVWVMTQRRVFKSTSYPGTRLDIASKTKAEYFAGLKKSRRQNLRNVLKRSAERITLRIDVLQQPDAATLDRIFELFWETYLNASTKFERLNRCFFNRIANEAVSHFVLLREVDSEDIVAFVLCFKVGSHIINKFIGIDRTQPKNMFLLQRLWEATLDWAIDDGATSIQSGQTGYSNKMLTGHSLVPLDNYVHVHNRGFHALFRIVGQRVTWQDLDHDLAIAIKANPAMARDQ